ncbi:MAG: PEPxxWA-CTERM sorting domain-containing protein [Sphingomonadaceae bacterium]
MVSVRPSSGRLVLAAGFILLGANAASATAVPAVAGFTGGFVSAFQFGATEFPLTIGWSFTTTAAFTVTALGFWDENADGLAASHRVGIWNTVSGDLLVDATVSAGTGNPLIGGFRYTDISPFALAPGNYTIGALIPNDLVVNDNWIFFPGTVTTIEGLVFGNGLRGADQAGFTMPTLSPNTGRFGPNFLVAGGGGTPGIPEPATWAMLIAGFGLVGSALRARRRVAHTAA